MTQVANAPKTIKGFFSQDNVKAKFDEVLGRKSSGFLTSMMQVVSDPKFSTVDPLSIYKAAVISASMDLVINNSIGHAYIVPYGNQAQFQIGWKGIVQLALRSGEYKTINVIDVYENQFKSFNTLTEEIEADFSVEGSGEIVGYCAYMELLNGFQKTVYWSKEKCEKHGAKFSKTYKYDSSTWKKEFDAMARKTVLKNMLSKFGILSIEMQTAITADQSVIKDEDTLDVEYVDVTENGRESSITKGLDNIEIPKSKK